MTEGDRNQCGKVFLTGNTGSWAQHAAVQVGKGEMLPSVMEGQRSMGMCIAGAGVPGSPGRAGGLLRTGHCCAKGQ